MSRIKLYLAEERQPCGVAGQLSWIYWRRMLEAPAPPLADCLVSRPRPHLLVIWEPLLTKAPAPPKAQPYCCYINTVIFYHFPYICGFSRPWFANGRWRKGDRRSFVEWDKVKTRRASAASRSARRLMPDGGASATSLPFQEAIDFFRQKVNVPTAKWADMLHGAHTRAFTVAGATKEGMLTDFRAAVDKAISQGTTLEEFRKDFDAIVQTYGWDYKGTRGWRTRTIYSNNLTTAYAAGRWAQMTDPDVVRLNPYWMYRHADGVKHPRPEHLAWNGMVWPVDDPVWKKIYPPNGWGCHCFVEPISRRELKALGKNGPDTSPDLPTEQKTLNTSAGPVTIDVPKGVDPGWGYDVGEAAYGRRLSDATMQAWREQGAAAWERLEPSGDWRSAGRPEQVPVDAPKASLGPKAPAGAGALEALAKRAIGGVDQQAFTLPDGDPVLVDAAALAKHIDPARAPYLPFLPELLADPFEIWISFERHKGTGQVQLRKRIVKVVRTGGGKEGLLLVAQASAGRLEAYTFVPIERLGYLQRQRVGRLLWGRKI